MADPNYVDPLAELKSSPGKNAPLDVPVTAGPTIALVFGSNIERVLEQKDNRTQVYKAFGPFTNTAGLSDENPQPLITGAVSILRLRYPRLEAMEDLATAAQRKVATTIVLDIRIILGQRSGQNTIATVTAVFLDANQEPVSRIEASGTSTVPYPAWTVHFREASDIALEEFRKKVIKLMS